MKGSFHLSILLFVLLLCLFVSLFSNETYTVRHSYMQENRIYSIHQQNQYPLHSNT